MYQKIRRYFLEDLWNFPLRKEEGGRRVYIKFLRITVLAIRDFFRDQCILHAGSLTYYTIMATVPILTLSFAVARGFGFHDFLRDRILQRFEKNQEILLQLLSFVDRMIEQAKGSIIAGMGIVILFWSVTQLLSHLENSMNQIWKIRKLRSWRRIFSDYFALMLIMPCLFFLSMSASVLFVNKAAQGIEALHLGVLITGSLIFIANLVPYCLFWFLFTFLYAFMPTQRIALSSAFLGGVIGGTIYLIVQWGYFYFQIGFNRIGTIYGSFAAFPLFLIWVHVSWLVLLFGAEISYAHQTLEMHEFEAKSKRASISYKRLLSLWIVHLAISKFAKKEPLLTREAVKIRYQVPYALAAPILDDLIRSKVLVETPQGLLPAKPVDEIRISDVITALETEGDSDFPFIDSESLAPFEQALEKFRALIENSSENKLLFHL